MSAVFPNALCEEKRGSQKVKARMSSAWELATKATVQWLIASLKWLSPPCYRQIAWAWCVQWPISDQLSNECTKKWHHRCTPLAIFCSVFQWSRCVGTNSLLVNEGQLFTLGRLFIEGFLLNWSVLVPDGRYNTHTVVSTVALCRLFIFLLSC